MQRTWVQILVREDPTCHGATKLVHRNYWSLGASSLSSTARETTAVRSLSKATERCPQSLQLEKAQAKQQRPSAATEQMKEANKTHQVLVVALGIFGLHCGCAIFSCSMWALSCGIWALVSWLGIEPGPLALGAWSLGRWTTREVPEEFFVCFYLSARGAFSSYLGFSHTTRALEVSANTCCEGDSWKLWARVGWYSVK